MATGKQKPPKPGKPGRPNPIPPFESIINAPAPGKPWMQFPSYQDMMSPTAIRPRSRKAK